jgi:hypothetical protein
MQGRRYKRNWRRFPFVYCYVAAPETCSSAWSLRDRPATLDRRGEEARRAIPPQEALAAKD